MEKRGPLRFKAPRLLLLRADGQLHWTKHLRSSIELQRRAFEAAQQTGNLQTASYTRNAIDHAAARGRRSAPRGANAPPRTGSRSRGRAKFGLVADVLTTQLRLIRLLRGSTPRFLVVRRRRLRRGRVRAAPGGRSEPGDLRRLVLDPQAAGALLRARLRRRPRGRGEGARPCSGRRGRFPRSPSTTSTRASRTRRRTTPRPLEAAPRAPAGARRAPPAAADLGAELPRELRRTGPRSWRPSSRGSAAIGEEAERLYEQAIRSARDNGFVHNEAIAYETAARFYRGRGLALIADTLPARGARPLPPLGRRRQGARSRAAAPAARRAQAARARRRPSRCRPSSSTCSSVVKASQTISGVMVREQLLRTLLHLVLEEGRRAPGPGPARARRPPRGRGGGRAPRSCRRLRQPGAGAQTCPSRCSGTCSAPHERVLLDDAAADAGRFSGDRVPGARPSPLGAVPADSPAGRGRRAALSRERSRPRRLHPRAPAGARAARRAGRDLAGERAAARARARRPRGGGGGRAPRHPARRGDRGDDVDPRLRGGVRRAHPRVRARRSPTGRSSISSRGGQTVRLAGAHRDPEKEPLLRELAERYPAGAGSHAPATTVLDERQAAPPRRRRRRGPARACAVDEHHAELIERLGTRSVIVVPLVARDTTLGALTLASASPGRFGPADLEAGGRDRPPRRPGHRQRPPAARDPARGAAAGRLPLGRVARASHADDLADADASSACSARGRPGNRSRRSRWTAASSGSGTAPSGSSGSPTSSWT